MFNTSTQSTSVILVGAARCPMIQLATTVASRLLISARLSGRSLRLLHPSLNAALGLMYCSRRLVSRRFFNCWPPCRHLLISSFHLLGQLNCLFKCHIRLQK
ncbi:hypothetical protein T01_10189 [Trichinella spiralis]|uniref:Uncharacterized protein n=1 Tax=Trichinella spiralis TaxID=6334 RepID=A0A0V1AUW1_TRISP|nr:hypothetical protein T01_10189 [Trichinella spiralis]